MQFQHRDVCEVFPVSVLCLLHNDHPGGLGHVDPAHGVAHIFCYQLLSDEVRQSSASHTCTRISGMPRPWIPFGMNTELGDGTKFPQFR